MRTNDGRIQHIREGKVEYEVAGPKGGDTAPACLLGDDSVLLSGTVKGGRAGWVPGSCHGWCVQQRAALAASWRLRKEGKRDGKDGMSEAYLPATPVTGHLPHAATWRASDAMFLNCVDM